MNVFFVHCSLYCLRNQIESQGKRLLPQMKNLLRFVSERQVIFSQIPKLNPVLDDMVNTPIESGGQSPQWLFWLPGEP